MEPLAVLGLVANITQLVDAAIKAFTVCREVYTLGRTIEDSRMAFTSQQLLDAYDDLTAQTLKSELDSLQKPPGSGLRGTLKKAWLKQEKAKTIDKLKRDLDEYERILDSKILIDVRQTLGALDTKEEAQGKSLEQQLSRLSSDMNACQLTFADRLRSEFDKHIKASEAQHEVTRDHVKTHVTTAMQNLTLSHTKQFSEQKRQQHDQQQHDQFINSLWFRDLNTRMNDVAEAHSETFHWMFEVHATRPWDSFCSWLQADDHLYWINGKPGSGKSTLMKFLTNDSRTRDLLAQWSSGKPPLIVKFYFWLSGSEMQRSFKGFLCSVIYQLVHDDGQLVTKLLCGDLSLPSKKNPEDWSKKELQKTLTHILDLLDRPLCLFLDGLDDFDQKDDVEQLLNLLEHGSTSRLIKVCISSRPEHYITTRLKRYKQLRLQDLTAHDMELCIRTELKATRARCSSAAIDDKHLNRIVYIIAEKADGVFLWVHYALNSLVRGMRNEDGFGVLLDRIEELPSGMHQLYVQMWKRLNGDQQHYQEQATRYFAYVSSAEISGVLWSFPRLPLSVFEMLVALHAPLQNALLNDLKPQDPAGLAQQCEDLKAHLLIRSAGLLEFSTVVESEKPLCGSAKHSEDDLVSGRGSIYKTSHGTSTPHSNNTLTVHHSTRVRHLHRTARDFLLYTEEGQNLLGRPKEHPATTSYNIIRARMGALMQRLTILKEREIDQLMEDIRIHLDCYPSAPPELETDLLITLRRICQISSIPDDPRHHIGYRDFWAEAHESFEAHAAGYGFVKYIQKFVQDRVVDINPYCLGSLVMHLLDGDMHLLDGDRLGADYATNPEIRAAVHWLASSGADLHTTHFRLVEYRIPSAYAPASDILLAIEQMNSMDAEIDSMDPYNSMLAILPYLKTGSCHCLLWIEAPREQNRSLRLDRRLPQLADRDSFLVEMSLLKLCDLVMGRIERKLSSVSFEPQWR
ncbi:MAG: hypothetical protein LQ348_003758 [Seirophora lacunosa]|nr:MAG: hypothetical protein LQ348_003758 [Seirophora lacunosa]